MLEVLFGVQEAAPASGECSWPAFRMPSGTTLSAYQVVLPAMNIAKRRNVRNMLLAR